MKKLIIIFCFLPCFSFSQVNTLIVDSTKTWSVLIVEFTPGVNKQSTYKYKFKGDTIINEKIFKKILVSSDSTGQVWIYTNKCIREDSGKVYIYSQNNEHILYDFNLIKGDTIKLLNMFGKSNDWVVDSVDSIEILGTFLKRITLKFHDYLTDYRIEGIGSTLGVVYSGNFIYDYSTELLCAMQQNISIFNNPAYNSCFIYTGINNQKRLKVRIYPTIVQDYLKIEAERYPLKIFIIDLFGSVFIKETIIYDKQLFCKHLPSGLYFVKIQNENYYVFEKFIKQ